MSDKGALKEQVGRIVFGPSGAARVTLPKSFTRKMKKENKAQTPNQPNYDQFVIGLLIRINRRIRIIMATQAELTAKLTAIGDKLDKAIEEIKAAIANTGNTTPETDAAVARLEGVSQALDELNPDAPAPTPTP